MPKKFQGENTKSAAARARKAEAKAAADARKQKELEDAYWKDEDKHVMRKEQRKEEKEKRRLEQLERKKETQRAPACCSVAEEADRHPERRMRAAFTAFEEAQLPRLKQENPNMRLSQLKQLLKKEWLRSPENPMNQRALPFNAPK
ncbi:coiled-coil domain-containing protein 124 [Fukomys damarensis]|uniref:coiled-coil domain-containing protein 124 n=1 Tax=Fukomys damarensis TaxID=885580 RepID=UPI00053F9420|nr:coiled-coil domain-containing protein 124 [Fukomys damarensis]